MLVCVVFGSIFVVIGAMFFDGLALRWVEGWQTMPAEEKEKIQIKPLCRNIGTAIILAGGIILAAGLFPAFADAGFRWAMVGWLVLCGLDVFYIGKSGRYIVSNE